MHRVSTRASKLIFQLIVQDPKNRQMLDDKHARLIEMIDIDKLTEKRQDQLSVDKKSYILFGLFALAIFVISTVFAARGLPAWEQNVFESINGWHAPQFVTTLARVASDSVWLVVFLVALLFLFKKYFWAAWRLAVPAVLSYGATFIVEHIVGRARPEALLPLDTILRATQDGMGFPSGHVATITAVVATLWLYLSWPLRIVGALLIIAIAWSRVYLGVHFPLDVVSGFAVGVGVVCVLHVLPHSWRKRFKLA